MNNIEKKNTNDLWGSFNSIFRDAFAREMKTDIEETDTEYVLDVELPGIAKENVEITFEDGSIVIHAKQEENASKNKSYIAKERTSLDMTRSYYLDDADENKITAKMENGILTVHVAKIKEIPNPKKVIEIE